MFNGNCGSINGQASEPGLKTGAVIPKSKHRDEVNGPPPDASSLCEGVAEYYYQVKTPRH